MKKIDNILKKIKQIVTTPAAQLMYCFCYILMFFFLVINIIVGGYLMYINFPQNVALEEYSIYIFIFIIIFIVSMLFVLLRMLFKNDKLYKQ